MTGRRKRISRETFRDILEDLREKTQKAWRCQKSGRLEERQNRSPYLRALLCGSPFPVIRSFVQVIATVIVPEGDKASDLPWLTSFGSPKDGRREFRQTTVNRSKLFYKKSSKNSEKLRVVSGYFLAVCKSTFFARFSLSNSRCM